MTTRKPKPKPPTRAQSVRASEARKVASGGMRMPGGVLSPEAARALRYLVNDAEEYATASSAIAGALIHEAERVRRRK